MRRDIISIWMKCGRGEAGGDIPAPKFRLGHDELLIRFASIEIGALPSHVQSQIVSANSWNSSTPPAPQPAQSPTVVPPCLPPSPSLLLGGPPCDAVSCAECTTNPWPTSAEFDATPFRESLVPESSSFAWDTNSQMPEHLISLRLRCYLPTILESGAYCRSSNDVSIKWSRMKLNPNNT